MGGKKRFGAAFSAFTGTIFLSGVSAATAAAAAPSDAGPGDGFWIVTVFQKGGPMMWPILFCSILAVAIAVERSVMLKREKVIHPEFLREVRGKWQNNEFDKALEVCGRHTAPMSRIVRAGLLRWRMGILEIERAVEGAGNHESTLLSANLRGLGVIANIAPMLGLLGTVAGMIKAFNVISVSGPGNPELVANGISEALITTASGLIVGIPALAVYHFFRGKVDGLVFEMEEISITFMEEIGYSLQKEKND